MATKRDKKRKRAGSSKRQQLHRTGGDWTSLNLPPGLNVWRAKEGLFRLDIIPYVVKNNPFADADTYYYERTYFRHAGIGPDNSMYCCLAKNWKKPCPICEYRSALGARTDGNKEVRDKRDQMIKDLSPKERQMWLLVDTDSPEKGVQLLEISNFAFGMHLDEAIRDAEETEDHIRDFDDFEGGSTLKVRFKDQAAAGFSFLKVSRIDFTPRSKGIDPKLLDHGFCLDDLLAEVDYDELKKIFLQTQEDDDDKIKAPDPHADDDDDEEDVPFDEPDEEEVPIRKTTREKPKTESEQPADDDDDDDDDDWG